MPSEILENISLYCLISLANFSSIIQLIADQILYNKRIRYFYFVTVVLAKLLRLKKNTTEAFLNSLVLIYILIYILLLVF